jgi:hypothetical protein
LDPDSRPKTSDNRLNAGNGKRLHDKGTVISRSIDTSGIYGCKKILSERELGEEFWAKPQEGFGTLQGLVS